MTVKLPTDHHLELLSFKGGCTGLSESALVKMPHCWKYHARLNYDSLKISDDIHIIYDIFWDNFTKPLRYNTYFTYLCPCCSS